MKALITNPSLVPTICAALNLLLAGRLTAQTFTTLHSFVATGTNSSGVYTNSDGASPYAGLILGSAGNILYGEASEGGSSGQGTVFAINLDGTSTVTLHDFAGSPSDGASPAATLVSSGNTLYGTAIYGGSTYNGMVFAVHTDGSGFTNLHDFTSTDGSYPRPGLILSSNILYGTTIQGGGGAGTVFAVRTDGSGFTTLHSFTGGSDGGLPYGVLVLTNNTLYGTASQGGSGAGMVFAIHTHGSGFTNLHSFTAVSDGAVPFAGLIISGNTLYGTAQYGGSSGNGTVFAVNSDGSGFTNLHSFAASVSNTNTEGANPFAGLILSGNTLYGTAEHGGNSGRGTVFAVNTDGTGFTTLHSFTPTTGSYPLSTNSDGADPQAGLVFLGNALYGTAHSGGSSGNGTVFSISFRPQLTITPSGTNVILSWPLSYAGFSYAGYHLQETANLAPSGVWSTVSDTNPPVIVSGQFIITRPMLGPRWSYRLAQ